MERLNNHPSKQLQQQRLRQKNVRHRFVDFFWAKVSNPLLHRQPNGEPTGLWLLKMILFKHSILTHSPDVICQMATEKEPVAIIASATPNGKDVAPRIAAKLNTGLLADCISIEASAVGTITGVRPVYSGKLHQTSAFAEPVNQVVTVRPQSYRC